MALAKPVIATGFSGNTDFMTPANSYLVDWTRTAVGPDAEHYPAEGSWAEPSLEHAVAQLRAVHADQAAARERGARAARDVAATLSVEAIAPIARARLELIARRPRAGAQAPAPGPRVTRDLELGTTAAGAPRGALRGAARKGLFRVLRPYSSAQERLDAALAESVRALDDALAEERAARLADRTRHARRVEGLEERLDALARDRDELRRRLDELRP
jgi:hypothetical protein